MGLESVSKTLIFGTGDCITDKIVPAKKVKEDGTKAESASVNINVPDYGALSCHAECQRTRGVNEMEVIGYTEPKQPSVDKGLVALNLTDRVK